MDSIIEKAVELENIQVAMNVLGNFDENLKMIEDSLSVKILSRDNLFKISGANTNVEKAKLVIKTLEKIALDRDKIDKQKVRYLLNLAIENQLDELREYSSDIICITAHGKPIKSKTNGQKKYIRSIKKNCLTFSIGPAGTGKTFLAVAMAVKAFKEKKVDRIILTRPAVEAGEKLGFLPGDLQNKVDPYLRPLYDALYEMMGYDSYHKYVERNMIEVAPLAYMRGRTLDNSFIILDEAQNTTSQQMKMFLTRIGFDSKVVVTGDITQIDLPSDKKSGLIEVTKILKNVKGIEFLFLTEKDVVRHELVQEIIKAYDKFDKAKKVDVKKVKRVKQVRRR